MITETRPLSASIFGLIAVVCAILAWRKADWSDVTRLLLAGVALVYGVIFLAWAIELFGYLLGRMIASGRAAWYSPIVRQLELISHMNELQLAAVGKGLVNVTKIPSTHGLVVLYRAPGMVQDLDRATIQRWTDYCASWPKWPELPPQHGMPQNQDRMELRSYTALVVTLGLADPPHGSDPAHWLVPVEKVAERLEL